MILPAFDEKVNPRRERPRTCPTPWAAHCQHLGRDEGDKPAPKRFNSIPLEGICQCKIPSVLVCPDDWLVSLCSRHTPDQLRLLRIDLKRVEPADQAALPHAVRVTSTAQRS